MPNRKQDKEIYDKMKQGSSVSKGVSQNVDTTIASSDIVLIYAQI